MKRLAREHHIYVLDPDNPPAMRVDSGEELFSPANRLEELDKDDDQISGNADIPNPILNVLPFPFEIRDPRPTVNDDNLNVGDTVPAGPLTGWVLLPSNQGHLLLERQAFAVEQGFFEVTSEDEGSEIFKEWLTQDWSSPGKQHNKQLACPNGRVFNSILD